MSLTPYVIQGGEQVYQQPFACQNVLFYGMILQADERAIQSNVCDKLFNNPSGEPGRFVPAGPFVLLALCRLDKLTSETDPYSDWGAFGEQEVAFWVPVIDTVSDKLYFAFPYIWVDNAYALSMGREIYGFPKQLGKFEIPTDVKNATHFSLQSLALKTLSPSTMGVWQQILEVNQTSQTSTIEEWESLASGIEKIIGGAKGLGGWKPDLKLVEHLIGDLIHLIVPFVLLKQIRDVADGSKACYQSIIETNCRMTKWHGGGLLDGEYSVTINDVQSEPISHDLGLSTSPITPEASFWCSFDFYIGDGLEIWKA